MNVRQARERLETLEKEGYGDISLSLKIEDRNYEVDGLTKHYTDFDKLVDMYNLEIAELIYYECQEESSVTEPILFYIDLKLKPWPMVDCCGNIIPED